jgi:8-oxo-dGTP diphosphatase
MNSEDARIYPVVPRTGVGAIVIKDNKVLLVKRGVEPNKGRWAIPGGMLKLGETMRECAAREILEETGVTVAIGECIYVFDLIERDDAGKIKFHFVVVDFTALYVAGEPKGADDAEEAGWFAPEDLDDLPVSSITMQAIHSIGFLI